MGEVERKKKGIPALYKIGGLLLLILVLGSLIYSLQHGKVVRKVHRQVGKVNPAQVPPETVAEAIKEKEEKGKPLPTPPAEKESKGAELKEEKEEGQVKKEKEWKIPPPPGKLQKVPKKADYTRGLPKPSSPTKLLSSLKKERSITLAERMKVITPRLRIKAVSPEKSTASVSPPPSASPKGKGKGQYTTVLAAGMFVPAVLSQGIKAPVNYKVPVRFKLTGTAVGVGNYSFDLNSCVVLGAGKGIVTGNTARIETELVKLSCQWPDGKVHTVPVTGYAVDLKDGKIHLAAVLEENESRLVLASFLQGAAMGAAEAAQRAQEIAKTTAVNETTSVTSQEVKNESKYVFWGAVGGALSQTQQILQKKIQRLESLMTADRNPGGKVYLVFTQDVRVPESWLHKEEKETYEFAGYER